MKALKMNKRNCVVKCNYFLKTNTDPANCLVGFFCGIIFISERIVSIQTKNIPEVETDFSLFVYI